MRFRIGASLVWLLLAAALTACQTSEPIPPTPPPAPTATSTATLTATPEPTATPNPTATATATPTRTPVPTVPPGGGSMRSVKADPGYSAASLPAGARAWQTRVLLGSASVYPNPFKDANNTYLLARTNNAHLFGLVALLRATHNPAIVEDVYRIVQIQVKYLADRNGDGYRELLFTQDCPTYVYCNTDERVMDEIMAHTTLAVGVYVLSENRALNAKYGVLADFMLAYLVQDYVPKWRARDARGMKFEQSLMHPYASHLRFDWYMYKLTGDAYYRDGYQRRAAHIASLIQPRGAGWWWDHRVPGIHAGTGPLGCQPTVYGAHTMFELADMHFEGLYPFSETAFMVRMAATFRDSVIRPGDLSSMAGDICGGGSDINRWSINPGAFLSAWDASGALADYSRRVYEADGYVAKIFIPAALTVYEVLR